MGLNPAETPKIQAAVRMGFCRGPTNADGESEGRHG